MGGAREAKGSSKLQDILPPTRLKTPEEIKLILEARRAIFSDKKLLLPMAVEQEQEQNQDTQDSLQDETEAEVEVYPIAKADEKDKPLERIYNLDSFLKKYKESSFPGCLEAQDQEKLIAWWNCFFGNISLRECENNDKSLILPKEGEVLHLGLYTNPKAQQITESALEKVLENIVLFSGGMDFNYIPGFKWGEGVISFDPILAALPPSPAHFSIQLTPTNIEDKKGPPFTAPSFSRVNANSWWKILYAKHVKTADELKLPLNDAQKNELVRCFQSFITEIESLNLTLPDLSENDYCVKTTSSLPTALGRIIALLQNKKLKTREERQLQLTLVPELSLASNGAIRALDRPQTGQQYCRFITSEMQCEAKQFDLQMGYQTQAPLPERKEGKEAKESEILFLNAYRAIGKNFKADIKINEEAAFKKAKRYFWRYVAHQKKSLPLTFYLGDNKASAIHAQKGAIFFIEKSKFSIPAKALAYECLAAISTNYGLVFKKAPVDTLEQWALFIKRVENVHTLVPAGGGLLAMLQDCPLKVLTTFHSLKVLPPIELLNLIYDLMENFIKVKGFMAGVAAMQAAFERLNAIFVMLQDHNIDPANVYVGMRCVLQTDKKFNHEDPAQSAFFSYLNSLECAGEHSYYFQALDTQFYRFQEEQYNHKYKARIDWKNGLTLDNATQLLIKKGIAETKFNSWVDALKKNGYQGSQAASKEKLEELMYEHYPYIRPINEYKEKTPGFRKIRYKFLIKNYAIFNLTQQALNEIAVALFDIRETLNAPGKTRTDFPLDEILSLLDEVQYDAKNNVDDVKALLECVHEVSKKWEYDYGASSPKQGIIACIQAFQNTTQKKLFKEGYLNRKIAEYTELPSALNEIIKTTFKNEQIQTSVSHLLKTLFDSKKDEETLKHIIYRLEHLSNCYQDEMRFLEFLYQWQEYEIQSKASSGKRRHTLAEFCALLDLVIANRNPNLLESLLYHPKSAHIDIVHKGIEIYYHIFPWLLNNSATISERISYPVLMHVLLAVPDNEFNREIKLAESDEDKVFNKIDFFLAKINTLEAPGKEKDLGKEIRLLQQSIADLKYAFKPPYLIEVEACFLGLLEAESKQEIESKEKYSAPEKKNTSFSWFGFSSLLNFGKQKMGEKELKLEDNPKGRRKLVFAYLKHLVNLQQKSRKSYSRYLTQAYARIYAIVATSKGSFDEKKKTNPQPKLEIKEPPNKCLANDLLKFINLLVKDNCIKDFSNILNGYLDCLEEANKFLTTADFRRLLYYYSASPQKPIEFLTILSSIKESKADREKIYNLLAKLVGQKDKNKHELITSEVFQKLAADSKLLSMVHGAFQHPPYLPISEVIEVKNDENLAGIFAAHDAQPYVRKKENLIHFGNLKEKAQVFANTNFTDENLLQFQKQIALFRSMKTSEKIGVLNKLRQKLLNKDKDHLRRRIELAALVGELLAATTGQELNHTQYLVLLDALLKEGSLTRQVATGEGKSRILLALCAAECILGKSVDFVTSSGDLARRDLEGDADHPPSRAFFQACSINVQFVDQDTPLEDYFKGDNVGVNFSSPEDLNLFLDKAMVTQPGFKWNDPNKVLILDEADVSFYDLENHVVNFAKVASSRLQDIDWIFPIVMRVVREENFVKLLKYPEEDKYLAAIDMFRERLEDITKNQPKRKAQLQNITNDDIEKWLRAGGTAARLIEGEHFVIAKDQMMATVQGMRLVSTAIVKKDNKLYPRATYSEAIQQCLVARLNSEREIARRILTPAAFLEKYGKTPFYAGPINEIVYSQTASLWLKAYSKIFAFSGTAGSPLERHELREKLKMQDIVDVTPHRPSKLKILSSYIAGDRKSQIEVLLRKASLAREKRRPILIICETDAEREALYRECKTLFNEKVQTYHDNLDTKAKNDIINKAGLEGAITIATNIAGRGIDIAAKDKNLYVLATYLPTLRDQGQIFGRTARQGEEGEARLVLRKDQLQDARVKSYLQNREFSDVDSYIEAYREVRDYPQMQLRWIEEFAHAYTAFLRDAFWEGEAHDPSKIEIWVEFLKEQRKIWSDIYAQMEKIVGDEKTEKSKAIALVTHFIKNSYEGYNQFFTNVPLPENYSQSLEILKRKLEAPLSLTAEPSTAFPSKWESAHQGKGVIYSQPFAESRGLWRQFKKADSWGERGSIALDFLWRKRISDRLKLQGRVLDIPLKRKPFFANTKAWYNALPTWKKMLFCFFLASVFFGSCFAIATGVGAIVGLPVLSSVSWFFASIISANIGSGIGAIAISLALKLSLSALLLGSVGLTMGGMHRYFKTPSAQKEKVPEKGGTTDKLLEGPLTPSPPSSPIVTPKFLHSYEARETPDNNGTEPQHTRKLNN